MLAVALVVQGLVTPAATVVTARPLPTATAPRVAVVRPPLAPAHRSRCSVRLQTEDDEASGGDSEPPRRSAVLLRRLNDALFLLVTIAIQAIGAASVIGRPACTKRGLHRPVQLGAAGHGQPQPWRSARWATARTSLTTGRGWRPS
jgi:hypothetical protein